MGNRTCWGTHEGEEEETTNGPVGLCLGHTHRLLQFVQLGVLGQLGRRTQTGSASLSGTQSSCPSLTSLSIYRQRNGESVSQHAASCRRRRAAALPGLASIERAMVPPPHSFLLTLGSTWPSSFDGNAPGRQSTRPFAGIAGVGQPLLYGGSGWGAGKLIRVEAGSSRRPGMIGGGEGQESEQAKKVQMSPGQAAGSALTALI